MCAWRLKSKHYRQPTTATTVKERRDEDKDKRARGERQAMAKVTAKLKKDYSKSRVNHWQVNELYINVMGKQGSLSSDKARASTRFLPADLQVKNRNSYSFFLSLSHSVHILRQLVRPHICPRWLL